MPAPTALKDAEAFLAGFVAPLVVGGELRVGAPIDEPRAKTWFDAAGSGALAGSTGDIDAARARLVAQAVVRPPELVLGADELRLAVALYNALALAHPDLERWSARAGKRRHVLAVSMAFADLPPAIERETLLARHALLARLFVVARQDVKVSWWTGKAEFKGQRPPSRLIAWPSVRGVRVEQEDVPLAELLGFDEGQRLLAALLDASPLTDVLAPERQAPSFAWRGPGVLAILRDAELARFVAHAWIDPARAPIVLPAAALAWERLLRQAASAAHVRAVTAFLVHVGVLAALADAPATTELGNGVAGAGLFWALPQLAARVAPELAAPPGVQAERALADRWAALRERGLGIIGAPMADKLVAMFAARLAS